MPPPPPPPSLLRWASRRCTYAPRSRSSLAPSRVFQARRSLVTAVTHSGTFHCDEALAVALLRRHPRFAGLELTRTRDPALIQQAHVVVDVGGVYDPETLRFDHHQRTFESTFDENHSIRLSSAGLVWKHFGRDILAHQFPRLSPQDVDSVWMKLYDDVVQSVDAIDNGIPNGDGEPRYAIQTDLSSRIRRLNPRWTEPATDAARDAAFARASALAGQDFWDVARDVVDAWLPARALVHAALLQRDEKVPNARGQILTLPRATAWKQHLHAWESALALDPPILYVLYPDEASQWRVQAVPDASNGFASRKALPEPWRGVRDESLATVTGIPDSTFVHASGFIGGARSFEGAVDMARKALAWDSAGEDNPPPS